MDRNWSMRAGAAAFALGVSMAGPQAVGVAAADSPDDATVVSSATDPAGAGSPKRTATRAERTAAPAGGRTAATGTPPRSAAATAPPPRAAAAGVLESLRASTATASGKAAAAVRGSVPAPSVPRPAGAVAVREVAGPDQPTPAAPASAADAATAAVPAAASVSDVPVADVPVADVPVADVRVAVAAPLVGGIVGAGGVDSRQSDLPPAPVADFVAGAMLLGRRTSVGPAAAVSPVAPAAAVLDPNQHVLLIGVDGTNLSRILADPYNQAFFTLMDAGTSGAVTIAGHTSISNPGWTGILTGVWSETAGVSNNVFTPWTYDNWPTVFNQLEAADPAIATTSIGNWEVIAQIAGAGSAPADTIVYYPKINDSWLDTDDAVGARSIQAIQNTVAGTPSFQMTYFVGVDNTGHDTGGSGTPQYAEALRNVNDNIGDIMTAVDAWESANPGEEWTVMVVTDHGQVPHALLDIGLLAHGFQSPPETTVFVIADGPDFRDGAVNNTYSQVDVTPTILDLFGVAPEPYFAGTSLMDKVFSDYFPAVPGQAALKNALTDALDMYGYPDALTEFTLAVRTIAATIPYAVTTLVDSLVGALPAFLTLPVEFIGAVIYNLVNIPVQLIVRLTGVTGNSILPPQWWPYNPVPGTQPVLPAAVPDLAVVL